MLRCRLAAELEGSGQREYISHRRVVMIYFVKLYLSILLGRKRHVIITGVNVYINGDTYVCSGVYL